MNASIEEAENECLRSGAKMVSNRRKLIANAEKHSSHLVSPDFDYPRVDTDSFAFSMAVTLKNVEMLVHWALEMGPKQIHWHAHFIQEYSFRKPDDVAQLRFGMDNVLDWGIGSRKRKTIALVDRIIDLEHAVRPPPKKRKADDKQI